MSKAAEFHLTAEGLVKLKEELVELEGPKRNDLAKRLRVAIEQGDLKENADYKTAKEDQGFLEGRVQELKIMISNAVIITEDRAKGGVIGFGSTVTIEEAGREPVKYFMVGAAEADPRNGKISNESPIGVALQGHRVGDEVEVEAPAGVLKLKVAKVE